MIDPDFITAFLFYALALVPLMLIVSLISGIVISYLIVCPIAVWNGWGWEKGKYE